MKKDNRIKKSEEFQSIITKRNKFNNSTFIIYFVPRKLDHGRIGISASKKLGNAVTRNKLKRQLRMMLMELIDFESLPFDGVVIIKEKFKEQSYLDNKKDLELLINKCKQGRI